MKRRRTIAFAGVLMLFVAFSAWRVLWFPYQVEALYAAVPAHAIFVSEHARLAERWPIWSQHPLVRSVVTGLGVEARDAERVVRDSGMQALLNRLASRNTLVAYVPALGRGGNPAWVLVSWVGMQGQFMRWGFYDALLGSFESRTFAGGRKGWVQEHLAGSRSDQKLSLAVVEGVLIACVSSEPEAVGLLMRRVEDRAACPEMLRAPSDWDGDLIRYPDRVYMGDLSGPYPLGGVAGVWTGEFQLESGGRAEGLIHGPAPSNWGALPVATDNTVALPGLLGHAPGAILIGPATLWDAFSGERLPGAAVNVIWKQLRPLVAPGGRMFATLCTPQFNGRAMGFRIATLILGIQLAEGAATETAIGLALDDFNARFETTLIRRPLLDREGPPLMMVESVRRGPLSSLADGERPSYVVTNGWLLISSNRDTLDEVLWAGSRGTGAPDWSTELAAESGTALAWVNMAATGDALVKIGAVMDLLAIAQGKGRQSTPERRFLGQAQAWLKALSAMQTMRLWGNTAERSCTLRFDLGPRGSATNAPAP